MLSKPTLKSIKFSAIISLGFLLLFSTVIFSQTGTLPADSLADTTKVKELIKLSFEELLELPVSLAGKIPVKTSEAPGTVSIISHDEIEKYQWMCLNNLTANLAGFVLGQDRFHHVVNSRGISDLLWNKRLLLLVDGVPFSSFQSSLTNRAFSLNFSGNVEFIRGPGSVLYGSQAVTGVIGVNSLTHSELKGNGEAEIQAGDYGYRNVDMLTGARGKIFNTLISFTHFESDGNEYESYDALLKRDSQGNFIKQRTQDEKSGTHFWTKLECKDKLAGFSLSYHFQHYDFQMGHGFLTIFPEIEKTSHVSRNYFLAKYVTPKEKRKLVHEYVLKYDYEISDYDMQIAPVGFVRRLITGALDSSGVYERYVTPVHGGFARTQWIYFFENKATLLGGLEQNVVYYGGDKLHYSNVDLSKPGFIPFGSGLIAEVGPLYEAIKNQPVNTSGIYGQFASGRLLGKNLTATLGTRYDMYYYKYKNLDTEQMQNRWVPHLSPRAALVFALRENLALKAMYGHAFRHASPFEQFISNSLISGLNRENLNPEVINTYEFSIDWSIIRNINWRNTLFYSVIEDQIASLGRFRNLLETEQAGGESEFNMVFDHFSVFANYSYVERIKGTSKDTLIETSNALVWYPAHTVNAGASYSYKKAVFSVKGHYQDIVDRRDSEKGAPRTGVNAGVNYDDLRGSVVKSWYSIDANFSYRVSEQFEMRISSKNILDNTYFLVNSLGGVSPQPFDYRQAGRRIWVSMKLFL